MKKTIKQISKMKLSHFIVIGTIAGAIILLFAFTPMQQSKEWTAPATANMMKNSVASNVQSIAAGKVIYTKNCYDCHGKKGKGDGPKSGDLDKSPKDFTKEQFQKQTDGSLFWKITEGRKPMASFKKDLSEEQRWQVINYVRTLEIKK
ncbi:MAG: cytochrome c [Porphyromonadaceae bacterium]|nr:MAG: cytochrome c [Porphyromonadaceae bacterium]